MKLNKTMLIAALVVGSVFAANLSALAQDSTNTPAAHPPGGPGAKGGRLNFETIATQLALTDDEKTKAKPVFEEMTQKMNELRQDTTLDQAARGPKMKEIRDSANAKLKDILTPEQYDKWLKMSQRPRRGPAGGTPPPAADAKPQQ